MELLKKCSKCLEMLEVIYFHKNKLQNDGYNNICKICRKKIYTSPEYKKNENIRKNKTSNFIDELKRDKPCIDCGKVYPFFVMDYDHIIGEKTYEISKMSSFSIDRIMEEINKCELVCANCHRIRTINRAFGDEI